MTPIHITKSQIVGQLVEYQLSLFKELDDKAQDEWLKEFFLNGLKEIQSWGDNAELLSHCVSIGMFSMEE
jgi:hypothetical protein